MMQDINKLHILTLLGNLNEELHTSAFSQTDVFIDNLGNDVLSLFSELSMVITDF